MIDYGYVALSVVSVNTAVPVPLSPSMEALTVRSSENISVRGADLSVPLFKLPFE